MAKVSRDQLAGLSKQEKLKLLDAIEAKKQIAISKRDNFKPNGGQARVVNSEKQIRIVTAGNGGGKTALAVNEMIWAATGFNHILNKHTDVPARIIVLLDQPVKVATTWLPEIKKWYALKPEQLHKDGKPYYSRISFPNGSEVIFMTHDMEPMIFESIELDMLIADEPFPRHIWIALFRGGRKKGRVARFLLVGTPIAGSWLREDIVEPWSRGEMQNVDVIRYGTIENATNLSDGYIESFGRFLSDKEKLVRLEGQFADLDGLALAHLFSRKDHLIPSAAYRWPPNYPTVVIIDPALAKKHVAILGGITKDEQLVVLKEISLKGTAPQFAAALKPWMAGYRVVDIVCDSLGSSELTGGDGMLSFINSLNSHGIRCRATTYDEKNDESWLSLIQRVLAKPTEPDNLGRMEPQLKILDSCIGLIHDIETVAWEKVRLENDIYKPKLDIKKKDFLACLKYFLAAQPAFDKGRERVIRSKHGVGLNSRDPVLKSIKKQRNSW